MVASLTAPDGSAIGSPLVVTSAVARNRWVQETVTLPLNGSSAPTATLTLAGSNDAAYKSSFFVDDVALVRQCAAGAALDEGGEAAGPTTVMTTPVALAPAAYLPIAVTDPGLDEKEPGLAAVCRDVMVNGGFEDPASPVWTGVANTASTIYNVLPNAAPSGVSDPLIYTARPRTGARGGRVGATAVNGYWNELLQTVQLPSNVISLTLTYWRYLDTQETSTTTAYDVFRVGIETDKGIQIIGPQQIDNRSGGRGQWVQETLTMQNAVAQSNQRLWVTFKGTLDSNLPSALFVDDVALEVCALRP
jgi:hypothetical protein